MNEHTPYPHRLLIIGVAVGLALWVAHEEPESAAGAAPAGENLHILPEFQSLLDSLQLEGALVVFHAGSSTWYANDSAELHTADLPASTFKIPNSLIALETGVVSGPDHPFPWDGQPRRLKSWERDLTFREAFHASCVPCYQEIARNIGAERMRHFLDTLGYPGMDVRPETIDHFWLEGASAISAAQQIGFLRRLAAGELPVSQKSQDLLRDLMVIDTLETGILRGKTGWAIRNGNNTGWFVGWLDKAGDTWFLACRVDPAEGFDMVAFPRVRLEACLRAGDIVRKEARGQMSEDRGQTFPGER